MASMTWSLKVRGGNRAPMLADYVCPEHGLFEVVVARDELGDPPAEHFCPLELEDGNTCGRASEWTISAPTIRHPAFLSCHRGKADEKPNPYVLDTEPLADGRETYAEFSKRRAAMWAAHDADSDPGRPRKVFSR
jgi:hypothetical protein